MSPDLPPARDAVCSVCQRWPAVFKIVLTGVVMGINLGAPQQMWGVQVALAIVIAIGLALGRIPPRVLWHRLAHAAFWVLSLAATILLTSPWPHSRDLALALSLRTTVALTAAVWFISVTPFDKVLGALQQLGMSRTLLAMLTFMQRYAALLIEETARMRTAQSARQFGGLSFRRQWVLRARLLGLLVIRALNRSERVHRAMLARGFDGRVRLLERPQ